MSYSVSITELSGRKPWIFVDRQPRFLAIIEIREA